MKWAGTIIAVLAAKLAAAPPPKLIREIDLNQMIHEHPGLLPSNHSVRALAFSPDENRIAVAVGLHRKEGKFRPSDQPFESHLLILPLKDPSDQAAVQIDPGGPLGAGSVIWSPDSATLMRKVFPMRNSRRFTAFTATHFGRAGWAPPICGIWVRTLW